MSGVCRSRPTTRKKRSDGRRQKRNGMVIIGRIKRKALAELEITWNFKLRKNEVVANFVGRIGSCTVCVVFLVVSGSFLSFRQFLLIIKLIGNHVRLTQ